MSVRKKTYLILLAGVSFVFFGSSAAFPATIDEIAQELTCTCGCNMLVSACEGTMECAAAAKIKDQILAKLNFGQPKEEIIEFFVSQYGEKILSSPTKRGFNLVAWVLPFVAVLLGIGVVYALLKRWASPKKVAYDEVSFKQDDKIYLDKIEDELRTFEN